MQDGSFITDLFLVYAVTQLLTTAYGLTVIGALKPIIEDKLKAKGYTEREKNSLYKFNDKLSSVLCAFIPFYYGYKGMKLIQGKVDRAVDEEILSGDWITEDEQRKIFEKTELEKDESLFIPQARINFEKPETYKARRQDYSLYNTYESPDEFLEREMDTEESLNISPFAEIESVSKVVKTEVTQKDVACFISELSTEQLTELRELINRIIENEKRKSFQMILEKDIA